LVGLLLGDVIASEGLLDAFSKASMTWCCMVGCEKISQTPTQLTAIQSKAGTSQLATEGGAPLTSVKTSPGMAKTFRSRAPRDILGGGGCSLSGGGAGKIGGSSIECIKSGHGRHFARRFPHDHYPSGYNAECRKGNLLSSLDPLYFTLVSLRPGFQPGGVER
jgi:hypothetical protein